MRADPARLPRAVRGGWGRVLLDLELEARIGELTMPTAVIVGTADRLTPPEHADALAAALPHCTGLIEPGARPYDPGGGPRGGHRRDPRPGRGVRDVPPHNSG
ncbi:hypothetical protein GCM10017744_044370 [Streptomyces antimycoticus]